MPTDGQLSNLEEEHESQKMTGGERDVRNVAALLACRPGFLCRSVQLPKQREKKPQNRSRTEGPTGLRNGKQMAVSFDGSRLQSAVQERKLLIRCHPSSGLGAGGGGGQGEDRQSEA
ncbi:hypothetical protein D4764_05G0008150 [Takifugu flavidus]|uniref:Uncharacterized protein n=1 Tax=Takifugu flavidus TaxID=433684 RepID=A0A5C6N0X5_9TELE|nr:hypothetical protein D4764_05G0008150 [Takifugu flavidus]